MAAEGRRGEAAKVHVKLQKELMDQQAAAATVESDYHQAELQQEPNPFGHERLGFVRQGEAEVRRTRSR